MDGANADSDHSMTWEDFFGSTTDLTPTLIGIYDSLLEPEKSFRPETNALKKAKDARNDPPVSNMPRIVKDSKYSVGDQSNVKGQGNTQMAKNKEPSRIPNSFKLPTATLNKSSLYTIRTKSDENGASVKCEISSETMLKHSSFQRTFREKGDSAFGNLSPNVKRMISGATETTTLKSQKKGVSTGRSSMRQKSNIPLVGATSKISQSGVEILSSVEIYDQPCSAKAFLKAKTENLQLKSTQIKPDIKIDENQTTYDIPTNNRPLIYDIPNVHNNAFESLSLPYIDQSIELSTSTNDREFDIKLNSKDSSPEKAGSMSGSPKSSPMKIPKLSNGGAYTIQNKNDFTAEMTKTSKIPCLETVASTGNLKAVPVKEVAKLNPPTVKVSRPLSMSSIASSSSTSSSGVQNKGGVNSAYLASIESLDDHSDADITSANGSNNFVNSAGLKVTNDEDRRVESAIPGHTADEISSLSQLQRVCAEIVHTENVYVEDLRQVVEGYLQEWRREATFSEEELSELFNNIEHIYIFNRSLCEELSTCQLDATSIARCFVENTTGFSVYTSYCTGYPRTMERLAALASTPHSAREFRDRQSALGHPLPLASYLLKPVQRILKYHLLLQNVVKQCASPETEYALLKMTGIAQHIDDMKRKHEHAVRVQEIQSLLYGWNGPDLTTYGELCAEGTFRVFGAKAMRHAFLFDKMLLVTKNREDGILAYKSHIMCNNMMLVESIAGAPLSFHVIPWDAPRSQLTLQARSPRHKREWTLLLKRVILENYNAVIPSHARQLVMELGQNKTDDDMLAEKSHNLITQASMRKQLSAPEYLEKRKLERERRKSFENGTRGHTKKTNRKHAEPSLSDTAHDCDCSQVSIEKGIHYTCDSCYVDLCSDCETELNIDKNDIKCDCADNDISGDKCPECDRPLQYIDAGSSENLQSKQLSCKCSDFKSSLESFGKEFPLNKTRGYHSSDNIVGYTEKAKSKEELSEANNSLLNVRRMNKTCLKCSKIKENIPVTNPVITRKSRCNIENDKRSDTLRSKSKDDPQRSSKLSKIGTWRRKSEPGLQQNAVIVPKKNPDDTTDKNYGRGNEKIEFECRNCGSNKITKKDKANTSITLDQDDKKKGVHIKPGVEIKMYNTKNVPKKISKIKKNRTKGLRFVTDTSAKFYADLSTDVSTENILHISESNESLNSIDKSKSNFQSSEEPISLSKDEDIDEETYKKLIEKTDSFKKNELEKVKYLHQQKVIKEGSEDENAVDEDVETRRNQEPEEQPLEQIISQLLLQNREFQKLLKKQQLRNSAQRRHQRLLKSHSNPDEVVIIKNSESLRAKPKYYTRHNSENMDFKPKDAPVVSPPNEDDGQDEDHIYETLRVVSADSEFVPDSNFPRNVLPIMSPKNDNRRSALESDYVYLSFDKLCTQNADGIYDVPITSPEKKRQSSTDNYVIMYSKNPPTSDANDYDSLVEVSKRKKDIPSTLPGEYLPMSTEQQSPNTPEIWLSRQKEHFNVPTDRKSGSLPRSFQVITGQDENNLTSFKAKPNSNKTYLNRDGKVLSMDRPFTIASDQSEISYDDVENYMGEEDLLKFNKTLKSSESDYSHNISKSTLELEEEIDRCYKKNFEQINLDKSENVNHLTLSQPNLNTSITSSCEVLTELHKSKDVEVIHPEHKIYKPTSNVLSLKNVLSRFRNRTPNKTSEHVEINANELNESSPDSIKSDPKSSSSEKRSALNPRSYSKNLLQRFKNIITDDHPDDYHNKTPQESKNEVKVVITSTHYSPTTSSIVYSIDNDLISKSDFEPTTLTESKKEIAKIEAISHSCDNISSKHNIQRPSYGKSISMVSSIPKTTSGTVSQSKTNNNSNQNMNKLPIYMQGSKHLGARIAQADYVDPTTLITDTRGEKSKLNNVNVLMNKHSVRPDSLFSNSSFVTSSSESTYHDHTTKTNGRHNKDGQTENQIYEHFAINSDESFYERSFEKIEQMTDDVFRDSAVYSDQDDAEDGKADSNIKAPSKTITRIESIKRESSFKLLNLTVSSTINGESTTQTRQTIKIQQNEKANDELSKNLSTTKSKVVPPVPVKPKMSSTSGIPNKTFLYKTNTLVKPTEVSQINEPLNHKTVKRHVSCKPSLARSESNTSANKTAFIKDNKSNINDASTEAADTLASIIPPSIQMKRMSFERASLDSATRNLKATITTDKRSSIEPPKTTKTVLERRMELEKLTKKQVPKPIPNMKTPTPTVRPKSITTKVANFERSVSENSKNETTKVNTNINEKYIPDSTNDNNTNANEQEYDSNVRLDPKESWVKQVVNKFQ